MWRRSLALAFLIAITACRGSSVPQPVSGERIYRTYCQTCHGPDGRGLLGGKAYAADFTRPDGILLKDDDQLAAAVRDGRKGSLGPMPAFAPILNTEEITAVIAFIRSRFGQAEQER